MCKYADCGLRFSAARYQEAAKSAAPAPRRPDSATPPRRRFTRTTAGRSAPSHDREGRSRSADAGRTVPGRTGGAGNRGAYVDRLGLLRREEHGPEDASHDGSPHGDAAGLAALRRSPAQEERILEAEADLRQRAARGEPSAEADFRLHLAIAEAANNPRFSEFLQLIGKALIPRMAVSEGEDPTLPADYQAMINAEHAAILTAIQDNDEDGARDAMRRHLKNSQARYRQYLRSARS